MLPLYIALCVQMPMLYAICITHNSLSLESRKKHKLTDIHTYYMYVQINSYQQFECVWVAFTRTHIICYLAGMFFIKHTQEKEFIPAFTGCVLFQLPAALAILFHILHTNSQLLNVRFSNSSLHPTT